MNVLVNRHFFSRFFFGFILIFAFIAPSNASGILKSDNPFGKPANEIKVDIQSIPEPTLSKTKKAYLVENQFGFDVLNTETNWVIESFLNDIKPAMVVMDVGSGYGLLTRQALEKGAIVISNDISTAQLLYNLKKISVDQQSRLYLNNKDIRRICLKKNSVDLMIIHRTLHFFKGREIENILKHAHQWLKTGGRLYIVLMSKDHIAFRDKFKYDNSKKWPGENLVVKRYLPEQAYALPTKLHVMSTETLNNALENAGFQIEKTGYVALQKVGVEMNRDGKEAIGTIAVKKKE